MGGGGQVAVRHVDYRGRRGRVGAAERDFGRLLGTTRELPACCELDFLGNGKDFLIFCMTLQVLV